MVINNQISHTGQDPEPTVKLAKLVLVLAIAMPIYIGYKMIPKESYVMVEPTPAVEVVEETETEKPKVSVEEVVSDERLGAVTVKNFPGFTVERFVGQCNQTSINYLIFQKDGDGILFGLHDLDPFECLATDNFVDPNGVGRSGNYRYEAGNFYNDYGAGRLPIVGQSVLIGGKSRLVYPLGYSDHDGYFIPMTEHDQSLVIILTKNSPLTVETITIDKVLEKISIGTIK